MRLKLISCEILYRELCSLAAVSRNQVDVEFLPKGLHDIGSAKMRERLQQAVDAVDPEKYEAILLGYALCGNGLAGVKARKLPLVLPRAHDCIALFMGSKERYLEYFNANAGVYFRTTGWLERGEGMDQLSIQTQNFMGADYQKLVEKYGEDNARYLYEQLGQYLDNYRQLTFIQMGIEPDDSFERRSETEAEKRGWKYEEIMGDMSLLRALMEGPWDDARFQFVKPGQKIVARYDTNIVGADNTDD